jgi:hypothetical protein
LKLFWLHHNVSFSVTLQCKQVFNHAQLHHKVKRFSFITISNFQLHYKDKKPQK